MFVQNVSVQIKWNVFNLKMREEVLKDFFFVFKGYFDYKFVSRQIGQIIGQYIISFSAQTSPRKIF